MTQSLKYGIFTVLCSVPRIFLEKEKIRTNSHPNDFIKSHIHIYPVSYSLLRKLKNIFEIFRKSILLIESHLVILK